MNTIQTIENILKKEQFSREELIVLLKANRKEVKAIFEKANKIKHENVGRYTYFRGLIEFSNICGKNCLYCGIRKDNTTVERYNLLDREIVEAAKFAHKNKYGSIVLQSGELSSSAFTKRITNLLKKINKETNSELGITLSLGEQTKETYKEWQENNASRYLLRIESSDQTLYNKIHPNNDLHSFDKRLNALRTLQSMNYQTGTGVMIGLPGQSYAQLADDLIFFKNFNIDMVGMGPFIKHSETPMGKSKPQWTLDERFFLCLKMTALLRITMKDINIAAATALQAIDPAGREKAIKCGANVIMPNITPTLNRTNYKLYENKPCTDESADDCTNCMEARIQIAGDEIGYGKKGDSKHYFKRIAEYSR